MRWFKKIVRAILCLIPVFSIFFLVNGNSYSLEYSYKGIPWTNSPLPDDSCLTLDLNGKYVFDSTGTCGDGHTTVASSRFSIYFMGDAYNSSLLEGLDIKSSQSYLIFDNNGDYTNVLPIFTRPYSSSLDHTVGVTVVPEFYSLHVFNDSFLDPLFISFNSPFGTKNLPNFNLNSVPYPPQANSVLTCRTVGVAYSGSSQWNNANGARCPGVWNLREYVDDQILNYPYSSDGFYRYSSAISVDGTSYSNTFSFTDLFNFNIDKFSLLKLPLADMDSGYFYDYNNIYYGRSFDFNGSFQFDGNFQWHSDIEQTGTFAVYLDGLDRDSGEVVGDVFDCVANNTVVDGYNLLQYSCSGTLSYNYLYLNPTLIIANNFDDNNLDGYDYVWVTDDNWRFYTSYVVTDDDNTPGGSFNEHLTGGGSIPGDANDLIPGATVDDFFASLVHLFNFDFINPFAGIFNLFSDQTACASIPTIASMLNSSETQVCPWFTSNIRSIVTPVLGLSSMMLLVGFIVRWLGSSSGNLFEDSRHETVNSSGRSQK